MSDINITLRMQLLKLIGRQIELVVSTGYGSVRGELTNVGEDYIILRRSKNNIMVTTSHIVTVRRKEIQDD